MRRNARIRNNEKSISDKIIKWSSIGVGILTVVLIGLVMYSKNLSDEVKNGTKNLEKIANISGNNTQNTQNTESASTEVGKSIEQAQNELNNQKEEKEYVNNTANSNSNQTNTLNTTRKSNTTTTNTNPKTNTVNSDSKNETKKELNFTIPVDGEITKEFAQDNLIYSETLKEWVTHSGIDIKAEKTTVVKAAEVGTIKSIKNDPRYGLTIVIDHGDNMQTVYSNLLTSEFVVEGEKVEKGQSIGTVGNTGVFEVADESHLHFEILKDSIPQDPNIYLK